MKLIQIAVTDFSCNYHYSEKKGNNNCADYVRHDVDVYNELIINGVSLYAVYQTGLSFYHNDYTLPSENLEFSLEGGSSKALAMINEQDRSEIELYDSDLFKATIEAFSDEGVSVGSVEDILAVYDALQANHEGVGGAEAHIDTSKVVLKV